MGFTWTLETSWHLRDLREPVQALENATWCKPCPNPSQPLLDLFGVPSLALLVCPQSSCCAFSMAWGDWCLLQPRCDWQVCGGNFHFSQRLATWLWSLNSPTVLSRCLDKRPRDTESYQSWNTMEPWAIQKKNNTILALAWQPVSSAPGTVGTWPKFTAWDNTYDNCWCIKSQKSNFEKVINKKKETYRKKHMPKFVVASATLELEVLQPFCLKIKNTPFHPAIVFFLKKLATTWFELFSQLLSYFSCTKWGVWRVWPHAPPHLRL